MNNFATYYTDTPSLWEGATVDAPKERFVHLPNLVYPVNDPTNLCALLRVEEQSMLSESTTFQTEWVDLANPAGVERYKQIWQRYIDGWYSIAGEDTIVSSPERLLKLLRYTVTCYNIPPTLAAQLAAR